MTSQTFYLPEHLSPTFYNLTHHLLARGWKLAATGRDACFTAENLAFHEEAALCLEYKHLLADLVARHCPEVMPATYCLDDANWPVMLAQLAQSQDEGFVWILKPALLNNGQSIKIFTSMKALVQHFSGTDRLGGEHVLQQYIVNPHLLRDQRKYSIRHFMVLTNHAGAFLYPEGYFNVSRYPFAADDFTELQSHLTNEHLQGDEPNVIQIPTSRFESHAALYPQIQGILSQVVKALRQQHPQAFIVDKRRVFALFGADFMVDASGRVWLLEINHGSCFPISADHPLHTFLYSDFWEAILDHFVIPVAENSPADPATTRVFDLV